MGSPTEFTEFTEAFAGEEPPTDAYRWLGCVGFCGKIVWWLRGYGRMPYPPIVCSVSFVGALLALASGKAERRQLHPLKVCNKVAEYFSELCQRLFFS